MTTQSTVTPEQKRNALSEVLRGATFARSEQLQHFLRYVCEMEIAGRSEELNEYLIGVEALGRPKGYSPAEDSAVRSRAYELRKKLQSFYANERPDPKIRIEIAKGSYVPQFVEFSDARIALAEAADPAVTQRLAGDIVPHRWPPVFWFLAGVLLASACLGMVLWQTQRTSVRGLDPVIREAWGPLADAHAYVLICLSTNLFLQVRAHTEDLPPKVPKYPAPAELYDFFRSHRPLAPGSELIMFPSDNAVPIGEVVGVTIATNMLARAGVSYQILPERIARLPALRRRNVLLFGVPSNSEAAAMLLGRVPLRVEFDPESHETVIRDYSEPSVPSFKPLRDDLGDYSEVYGVITVIPSAPTDSLQALRTVIISGISSVGSQGAMEFFASTASMTDLARRFSSKGMSRFPSSYQVVVRCKTSQTLLLSYEFAAYRTLSH
jgi:hypothetical protein